MGINPKSGSSGVEFECPEEFGYYPHPSDCSQYYVCVFGGALLESCTGGLMYSNELQTCDWPRNVGCEVTDNGAREQAPRSPIVPQTFRFSSVQSAASAQTQERLPQHERQQERISQNQQHQQHQTQTQQAHVQQQYQPQQIQNIAPPQILRIAPNPIVTSRGQPKQVEAQQDIAKVIIYNFLWFAKTQML